MRIAVLLLLTACGSTIRATEINQAPRPLTARAPEQVEVFTSGPPARPHIDLTFYEVQQEEYSADDTREFIDLARVEAARKGCDGLVIGGITHEPTATLSDSNTVTSRKGLTATCIVYTDLDPQVADRARSE
jgi:hypothetical protein